MIEEERLYGTVNYAYALHPSLSTPELIGLENDMLLLLEQIKGRRYK